MGYPCMYCTVHTVHTVDTVGGALTIEEFLFCAMRSERRGGEFELEHSIHVHGFALPLGISIPLTFTMIGHSDDILCFLYTVRSKCILSFPSRCFSSLLE